MRRYVISGIAALAFAGTAAADCNRSNGGDAIAGALIGGAIGAIVGDAIDDSGRKGYRHHGFHGHRGFHRGRGYHRGRHYHGRRGFRGRDSDTGLIAGAIIGGIAGAAIASDAGKPCNRGTKVYGPPHHDSFSYNTGHSGYDRGFRDTRDAGYGEPDDDELYGGEQGDGLRQGEVFYDADAYQAQRFAPPPTETAQRTSLRTGGAIIPAAPVCEWTYRMVRYSNGAEVSEPVQLCQNPYTNEWEIAG
ncbi:MAG: hypothetical protein AAFX03_12425 [Pseudomonadota bacterium]